MNDKGDPPVTGVLKMRVEGQPVEPRITHEVLKVTEDSRWRDRKVKGICW